MFSGAKGGALAYTKKLRAPLKMQVLLATFSKYCQEFNEEGDITHY